MSKVEISVVIEDPAPPEVFGIGVAIYGISVAVDGEPNAQLHGRVLGKTLDDDLKLRLASTALSHAETDAEVIELVGSIIAHRGYPASTD